MRRLSDCFKVQVTTEAKLALVAMVAGRMDALTVYELADMLQEPPGLASEAARSLRVAGINVSKDTSRVELAPDWRSNPTREVKA